ncbi:hypothetical protein MKW98_007801, partial [Papaver atlanticum]
LQPVVEILSNADDEWILSTCSYGDDFSESIKRGNVHAVQFHPEKSGGTILAWQLHHSTSDLVHIRSPSGATQFMPLKNIYELDISFTYLFKAVVASMIPSRVYLKSSEEAEFKAVRSGREGRPIGASELEAGEVKEKEIETNRPVIASMEQVVDQNIPQRILRKQMLQLPLLREYFTGT